ncbi:hypothetical protein QUB80_22895 [Chlorogloeopsis sp. ULAP01]|uniref:hypothetical protein n=1 Tax=Chlorogloeopsis sp. ULAP01 TaxID=3056483 RepID=UPI0025AB08B0|nr:hypothetical protein [Chlorogloeopsis sp. ULAP01]MDM9383539.1 hypothetical protein [Chlorogloeopsis sp. ULAP01]
MNYAERKSQVELLIEWAKEEKFNDNEITVYDDFFAEGGIENPGKMTEQDAINFIKFLDRCDASNEFIASALTRLAQLAPASVVSQILESDVDGDGLTLAQELKLGTKATEYNTSAQIAAARQQQYQAFPSRDSDFEL